MGVTGLWRLIEPAGKPVPIETLENKVLAVDISIWLHQMVKGYQDAKGAPMPNAHLLGLFQRLCKLLYFRIKPVFVFDGGFPDLKKETIAKRQDNKAKLNSESERLKREILLLLGKKTAIGSLLGKTSPKKGCRPDTSAENDDLFKLPEMEEPAESSSESESEEETLSAPVVDLHSIDVESEDFKSLPLKEKHDLLIEMKETRKMNSWGKLHELPKDSDNFSDFQMNRLLKRRKFQECLEETEKEMGGNTMTLNELESLLKEEGINTNIESLPTKRIASNDTTRYLLISDMKQALDDAKRLEMEKENATSSKYESIDSTQENEENTEHTNKPHDELDDDLQKAIQMSLECADDEDKPKEVPKGDESPDSTYMLDSDYSDTSEEDEPDFDFNSAKGYIMQNTDYTSKVINKIIVSNKSKINTSKPESRVNEIMKELNLSLPTSAINNDVYESDLEEESQTIDLSSSDDECVEVVVPVEVNQADESVIEVNDKIEQETIELLDKVGDNENLQTNTFKEKPNLPSETTQKSDDSDSDEEFEEVPDDESVHQTFKPVVELNLEMKDSLEDDIFADVFENVATNSEWKIKDDIQPEEKSKDMPKSTSLFPQKSPTLKMNENELLQTEVEIKESAAIVKDIIVTENIKERNTNDFEDKTRTRKDKNKPESLENDTFIPAKSDLTLKNDSEKNPMSLENEIVIPEKADLSLQNNAKKVTREILTTEQLNSMAEELEKEQDDLFQEKSRLERMGRNITEQMTRDTQELLQIFGIPYVIAPSEAEAQCAFMESAKLTDGTITDDSDIWLFGGRTVYKNFFNQKKLVVQFLAERIDKSFNLSREQLILLALLVGSDYTTGVNGVGPVTAMEILASFSCSRKDLLLFQAASNPQAKYSALLTGLQDFKKWVRSGKRTDDTSLRKKLKNVAVTDDFPSLRVVQAYMEPKVETSKDKFTWGDPDLTVLRDFTKKKFGWSQNKLDEILNPVLKRMLERKSQKSMQDYFQRKIEFHSLEDHMSKRVKAAVDKMGSIPEEASMKPPTKIPRKRKPKNQNNPTADEDNQQKAKPRRKKVVTIGTDKPNDFTNELNLDEPSTSKVIPPNVIAVEDVTSSSFDIVIPKLDRYQEIIPQREQDRMNVLKTKLKAIEMYRKSKLNQKGAKKRRVNLTEEKADLSESDSD